MPQNVPPLQVDFWMLGMSREYAVKGDRATADTFFRIAHMVSLHVTIYPHQTNTMGELLFQMCNVPFETREWYIAVAQAVTMLNSMHAPRHP